METEGNDIAANICTNMPNVVQPSSYTNHEPMRQKAIDQKTDENASKKHKKEKQ